MKQDVRSARVSQLKQTWPAYGPLLDFYLAVREAQERTIPDIKVSPRQVAEYFAGDVADTEHVRIGPDGFPIDVNAAVSLFTALCQLGKSTNQHLASEVEKIEHCISASAMDLEALLQGGAFPENVEQVAAENDLDERVLSFLISNSIRPSIERGRDHLLIGFQPETWRKTRCPVCASPPTLSLLKGDPVLRYSLCSHCGCQWQVDRLSCSACGNRAPETRSYLQPENETTNRIDLCDKCNHYVKTIDTRKIRSPDPIVEDLATLHLDLVAVEKGYKRIAPNSWCE